MGHEVHAGFRQRGEYLVRAGQVELLDPREQQQADMDGHFMQPFLADTGILILQDLAEMPNSPRFQRPAASA
jgi:hypothetical protein